MNTQTPRRHRSASSSRGQRKTFSSTPRHKRSRNGNSQPRNSSSRGRSGPRRNYSGSPARSGGFRGGQRGRGTSRGRKTLSFNPAQFINTNPVDTQEEAYTPKNTFETFGLSAELVNTIHSLGMSAPTPIQDQIISEILKGSDVVGLAETGTGKTAAFLIPLIEKSLHNDHHQTLILTPTRELAIQIQEEMRKLTKTKRLYSTLCVGGTNIYPQIKGIRMRNHFVIGTPGRILDLIKRNEYKTSNTNTVVLDEADRMLDMGFIGDIKKILSTVPDERETLLFSATINAETEKIVKNFLKNPVTVSVKKRDVTNNIEQDVVPYKHHDKFETLTTLFKDEDFRRVLIFGSMKHSVEKLAKELTERGIKAESIHGNKSHNARQRALKTFKSGNARILVATDVAARGIHVDGITHVINYDLPQTFDDYVHRIGRTGRGSKKGKALTFIQK